MPVSVSTLILKLSSLSSVLVIIVNVSLKVGESVVITPEISISLYLVISDWMLSGK